MAAIERPIKDIPTAIKETVSSVTSPAPIPVAMPSVADPGPLGLAAFALTTFVLSIFNAGFVGAALLPTFLPVALFYGGIAQVLAGMWEFKKSNTFGALAFTSYGAFWLALAALVRFVLPGIPVADHGTVLGVFLLSWTIFTLYMLVASLKTSGILVAVFSVLTVTFVLLTVGELTGIKAIGMYGGYAGIVTAVLAWYASFAGVTNATWGRSVIPTFPIKK